MCWQRNDQKKNNTLQVFFEHHFLIFSLFTREEITRIKEISVYDIIMAVTKIDFDDIQTDVFRVPFGECFL